jgi:hypothetical protein
MAPTFKWIPAGRGSVCKAACKFGPGVLAETFSRKSKVKQDSVFGFLLEARARGKAVQNVMFRGLFLAVLVLSAFDAGNGS